MDLAEEGFQLQREGQDSQAKRLFLEALSLEREAALLLPVSEAAEPSRSILFRSAASLAYNAEEYETAEQLIAHGLSGFPPPEIKEELKDLYENIEFKRYLPHHGLNEQIRDWYQQGLNYRKDLLTVLAEWPIGEYSKRIALDTRPEPDQRKVRELLLNIERWLNSLGVYVLPGAVHEKGKLNDILSRFKSVIFEEEYVTAAREEADKIMDEALSLILSVPLPQTERRRTLMGINAFVVMAMHPNQPDLADTYDAIKEVCLRFGIQPLRADDVENHEAISDVVLQKILESAVVIADLTDARANVYYEIGYAHALNRRPILFRKAGTETHLLNVHSVPEYKSLGDLKTLLHERLEAILGRKVA
jgi:nucleoside 2-deoxyribosyltransferase